MTRGDRGLVDPTVLRAWAASAVERGQLAWPGVAVDEAELARFATARLASLCSESPEQDLHIIDASELYLAVACARGDSAAVVQFRSRYFDPVAPALRRRGVCSAQIDDVWQGVSDRLLVRHDNEPARILRYAGGSKISGLVRVVATRVALNWLLRERRHTSAEEWLDGMPAGDADPELHAIKRQHRTELKEELEAAIASLSARDRMLLRLHLVERLGIDAIAGLCRLHRATAARSLARAQEALAAHVRARLIARWRITDADLPTLKALMDSQIDLSLPRLLAPA